MKVFVQFGVILISFVLSEGASAASQNARLKTKNVVLVTMDGFRWQEMFGGADERLISHELGGVSNTNELREKFWRDTPEARRETLLPFFWNIVAKQGQLFGNTNKGSVAKITNDKKFSYPGYNEIFTGHADPRINSNDKIPNPNTNVLEWLQTRPGFKKPVAAFGNWDVFPYILNRDRSGLLVWTGHDKPASSVKSRRDLLSEIIQDSTPIWNGATFDSFIFHAAIDCFATEKPRVLYVGFGETDEWAHGGRYDNYLTAAHNADGFIRRLWETAQSIQQFRDKTTFVITTDHGRGHGGNWKHHGASIAGAEYIWAAVIGPDTAPLGERTDIPPITQSQLAATLAAFLGEDFHKAFPRSGAPITAVVGSISN